MVDAEPAPTPPAPEHGRRRSRGRPRRGRGRAPPDSHAAPATTERPPSPHAPASKSAPSPAAQRGRRSRAPKAGRAPDNTHRPPTRAPKAGRAPSSTDATDTHAPCATRPARARRHKATFGTQLTAKADLPPPAPVPEYADLRTRLIAELASDDYDCAICYHPVLRKQPIWSCARCHAVLHLPCVRTWAERSVQQMEEQFRLHEDPDVQRQRGHWRCPACQAVEEAIPRTYRCWCGRVTQPRGHAVPHSCRGACQRGCAWHGCAAQVCHPGPCPPCAATVRVACFCGREPARLVRCSQLRATLTAEQASQPLAELQHSGLVSCGAVCGRALACGHHTCTQPCHAGPCAPCAHPIEAPCHCGRHTRAMACGDRPADAYGLASAWSCGEPCDAPLACGVHRCTQPCHVRTGVAPCPLAPERVRTCPCGRTAATGRTTCRDPIPTCGAPCGRPRPCGHACTAPCHLGACPPCAAEVVQVCRCGHTKRTRPCASAQGEFVCTTPCKALRHCGKHVCGRACCPLAFQAALGKQALREAAQLDPEQLHACAVPCRKPLSCGQHVCEAPCHRGACAPCLRSSFTEAVCPCGRTVVEPPVPCGTVVQCSHPCALPGPPCGHPKVAHTCHPADTPCPPCVHLTTKTCVCGRAALPSVPCSRTAVRCGQVCGKPLACGQHTCTGTCHADGECGPCEQPCGRARAGCGHPCLRPCHAPAPCPDDGPCEAVVRRTCPCGHREQLDVCGSSAPLACTPACEVARRNARFASALGLRAAAPVEYGAPLRQYVALDARGAQAVQDVLSEFVQSPRASAQVRALLVAYTLRRGLDAIRLREPLLAFIEQLAAVYHVATERVDAHDVRLRRTRESRIPPVLLTEASAAQPARAALEARRAQQAACAQAVRLVGNALVLRPVPAALQAPGALDAALEGVRRGPPACEWAVATYDDCAVLHAVQLAPLSLAAIAQAAVPRGAEALRPAERRLAALAGRV
ncbi:FKBP12-associated protein [Malassezia caprae]|uniref:FKBP12-associated protein n=1 Tax=Malassezia caprae TaxID=1381934 RepID=A0AAF0E769_9BASI|nr:FKBP12-associated protein [Malassezia caprae]